MRQDVDPVDILAPLGRDRARVLAPAVCVVFAGYVAIGPLIGIELTPPVLTGGLAIQAILTLLAGAFMMRLIPLRWCHAASAGVLWCPIAGTLYAMYVGGETHLVVLLVVITASAGILLHTGWVVATLLILLALAIPAIARSGDPHHRLFIVALVTASVFALLIHLLMRGALLRAELHGRAEAAAAQALASQLEQLEQASAAHARLHDQLVHSQRMEAVGTLAAGIAHDMNNVLASIIMFAEIAHEEVAAGAKTRADLTQIIAQGERGAALTRGLLTFSRRGNYRKGPVRLANVIRDVLPLLSRTLPRGIEIHDELADTSGVIEGDSSHLVQMLVNLGVNAADAMGGTGKLVIALETVSLATHPKAPPGRYARLEVRDTGKGMDEATRLRAFEPFFTTKPAGRGTGLGLSMVWGIVHAHDGHIEIDSEPGRGTAFTVYLPLTDKRVERAPSDPATGQIRKTTVLVVDDERAVRTSMHRLLERMGLCVLTAENGADALDVHAQHEGVIEAVILDMGMPVMGGAACFRELRQRDPDLPVLIATGYADETETRELLAAGGRLIEKPFNSDELRRQISKLLTERVPGVDAPALDPSTNAGSRDLSVHCVDAAPMAKGAGSD